MIDDDESRLQIIDDDWSWLVGGYRWFMLMIIMIDDHWPSLHVIYV